MDLEALEAENDRGIAALGDRVGALRGLTGGIHGEVESQHRLLDSMVRWGAGGGGWAVLQAGMHGMGGTAACARVHGLPA